MGKVRGRDRLIGGVGRVKENTGKGNVWERNRKGWCGKEKGGGGLEKGSLIRNTVGERERLFGKEKWKRRRDSRKGMRAV